MLFRRKNHIEIPCVPHHPTHFLKTYFPIRFFPLCFFGGKIIQKSQLSAVPDKQGGVNLGWAFGRCTQPKRIKKSQVVKNPPPHLFEVDVWSRLPLGAAHWLERLWAPRAFFVCICLGKKACKKKNREEKKKEDQNQDDCVNTKAKTKNAHGFFASICQGKRHAPSKSAKENRVQQAWSNIKTTLIDRKNQIRLEPPPSSFRS